MADTYIAGQRYLLVAMPAYDEQKVEELATKYSIDDHTEAFEPGHIIEVNGERYRVNIRNISMQGKGLSIRGEVRNRQAVGIGGGKRLIIKNLSHPDSTVLDPKFRSWYWLQYGDGSRDRVLSLDLFPDDGEDEGSAGGG